MGAGGASSRSSPTLRDSEGCAIRWRRSRAWSRPSRLLRRAGRGDSPDGRSWPSDSRSSSTRSPDGRGGGWGRRVGRRRAPRRRATPPGPTKTPASSRDSGRPASRPPARRSRLPDGLVASTVTRGSTRVACCVSRATKPPSASQRRSRRTGGTSFVARRASCTGWRAGPRRPTSWWRSSSPAPWAGSPHGACSRRLSGGSRCSSSPTSPGWGWDVRSSSGPESPPSAAGPRVPTARAAFFHDALGANCAPPRR